MFNVCDLEIYPVLNRDIPKLDTRVKAVIGEHLKYSCIHWSSQLAEAPKGVLQDLLRKFLLGRELLYWLEALSLLSKLNPALPNLLHLIQWTSVSSHKPLR